MCTYIIFLNTRIITVTPTTKNEDSLHAFVYYVAANVKSLVF